MRKKPQQVLIVDDEPSMHRYMTALLADESLEVHSVERGAAAIAALEQGLAPKLVFLDVLMPEMDGIATLKELRKIDRHLNVVMMSCISETALVVQAMRFGAQDYLTKPFAKHELDSTLEKFLRPHKHDELLSGEVEELSEGHFFFCATPEMKHIRSQVMLVANVNIPVLLLGESGTGKEVVARLIHERSDRAKKPFLKVNCAALPGDLLESELFGYEAGAFTGAGKMKPGKFEQCNGGTLLLDEIGEMPPQLQAKLLHVLQDGEFARLGGRNSMKVDVRVLAATNINVEKSIADKTFREDLYYRLNTFSIKLPPLRQRKAEVPLLLRHMVNRMCESYGRPSFTLSQELISACSEADWPGNVRELNNFVKRYIFMGDEREAIAELRANSTRTAQTAVVAAAPAKALAAAAGRSAPGMRAPAMREAVAAVGNPDSNLKMLVRGLKDEAESEAIARALAETNWNRQTAAKLLNISYKALIHKMRVHGIRATPSGSVGINSRNLS